MDLMTVLPDEKVVEETAVLIAIDELLEMLPVHPTPEPDTTSPEKPRTRDLLNIAIGALKMKPPRYVTSLLGPMSTWLPPHRRFSEFEVLDLWHLQRMVKFLTNTIVPALPLTPPPFLPPFLDNFFWRPTVILQRPDHNGSTTTFPHEAWFLINGILTNDAVAQMNAAYLSYLFHRPITLIQNATDSFPVDMLECILGKEWQRTTEPVIKAMPVIYDALKRPEIEKVVVVTHSQGTIIMANVLRWLYALTIPPMTSREEAMAGDFRYADPCFIFPDDDRLNPDDFVKLSYQELAKLEVYNFATCANRMTYYPPRLPGENVPWIEHFGNERDMVARLGMLAPRVLDREIYIEGPRYVHEKAWGHLLNAHYLFPLADAQRRGRRHGGKGTCAPFVLQNQDAPVDNTGPRLFAYINGGTHPSQPGIPTIFEN